MHNIHDSSHPRSHAKGPATTSTQAGQPTHHPSGTLVHGPTIQDYKEVCTNQATQL